MKTALLLIGHGSKDPAGQEEFSGLVRMVSGRSQFPLVQQASLKHVHPLIAEGIDLCIQKAADRIIALPLFLTNGGDMKKNIPEELEKGRKKHPQITIMYGPYLGVEEKLTEIILERIQEVSMTVPPSERGLLLVGRGSSDVDAPKDIFRTAEILKERLGYRTVHVSFTEIIRPTILEGVESCVDEKAKEILILPYIIFTGIIVGRIRDHVEQARYVFPEVPLHLGRYIGVHPKLADLVLQRAGEAS